MKGFNYKRIFIIFSLFLFLCPFIVNATGTASTGFSSNNSVYIGDNIDIILYISNVSGSNSGLAAFGGNIQYDSSKLELVKKESLAPFTVDMEGNLLAGFGMNTIKGNANIIKFTFKTKQLGNTTITYSGSIQPDLDNEKISILGTSKTIQIVNPPSSNNNLSNLMVNVGNLLFDKNKTDYQITVDSNISSIQINAAPEDNKATVNGIGTKSLNYGNNIFTITVTAENNIQKKYVITVYRKDDRSNNINLSNLSVENGKLTPSFNKDIESYSITVPYNISSLKINTEVEDKKSKVSISNNNLVAEETTDVTITVTAENGNSKTYIIHATRQKNPDKVLSNDNYLNNLSVSNGILSPPFSKNQEKYIVYLPYEIDEINIDAIQSDTKYAKITKTGPNKLVVGNNTYTITVTAEDNSIRNYTVVVSRGMNLLKENLSSNTKLKNIKIENGKLLEQFNKNKTLYTYKKKKKIKVIAISEDKNSNVTLIEQDNVITILVQSISGEIGVYTLILKKNNYIYLILVFILVLIVLMTEYFIYRKNKTQL